MFVLTEGLRLPQTIQFVEDADYIIYDADIQPLSDAEAARLGDLVTEIMPLGMAAREKSQSEKQGDTKLRGLVRGAFSIFSRAEFTADEVFRDHLSAIDTVRLLAKEAFENRKYYVKGSTFTNAEIKAMRTIETAFVRLNSPHDSQAYDNGINALYAADLEGRVTSTSLLMSMHQKGVETYRHNGEVYVPRDALYDEQEQLPPPQQ